MLNITVLIITAATCMALLSGAALAVALVACWVSQYGMRYDAEHLAFMAVWEEMRALGVPYGVRIALLELDYGAAGVRQHLELAREASLNAANVVGAAAVNAWNK